MDVNTPTDVIPDSTAGTFDLRRQFKGLLVTKKDEIEDSGFGSSMSTMEPAKEELWEASAAKRRILNPEAEDIIPIGKFLPPGFYLIRILVWGGGS